MVLLRSMEQKTKMQWTRQMIKLEKVAYLIRSIKLSSPPFLYYSLFLFLLTPSNWQVHALFGTIFAEKGVPNFWLTAMKTHEILAEEVRALLIIRMFVISFVIIMVFSSVICWRRYLQISERDEDALKSLKDIKWCRIDDPKGFKLDFFFDTNPYFKNSVLTKVYHMIDDDEPILEKAIG